MTGGITTLSSKLVGGNIALRSALLRAGHCPWNCPREDQRASGVREASVADVLL